MLTWNDTLNITLRNPESDDVRLLLKEIEHLKIELESARRDLADAKEAAEQDLSSYDYDC